MNQAYPILSGYPLIQGAQCLGVLLIEKSAEAGFNAADVAWMDVFVTLLRPVIEQRTASNAVQ